MLGYVCSEDAAYVEAMRLTMIDQNCTEVLFDHKPASAIFRPNLTKLLDQIEPPKAVVVDRLNSFGGDLRDVLAMIHKLHEQGRQLIVLEPAIDTAQPTNLIDVANAFAQVIERKPSLYETDAWKATKADLAAKKINADEAARRHGISRATLYRHI